MTPSTVLAAGTPIVQKDVVTPVTVTVSSSPMSRAMLLPPPVARVSETNSVDTSPEGQCLIAETPHRCAAVGAIHGVLQDVDNNPGVIVIVPTGDSRKRKLPLFDSPKWRKMENPQLGVLPVSVNTKWCPVSGCRMRTRKLRKHVESTHLPALFSSSAVDVAELKEYLESVAEALGICGLPELLCAAQLNKWFLPADRVRVIVDKDICVMKEFEEHFGSG